MRRRQATSAVWSPQRRRDQRTCAVLYLVCYDISNDSARNRMSKALLDFGSRIQESVFECPLNDLLLERMMTRLERIPLGDIDRVRVYRLCGPCVERVRLYGPGDITTEPDVYLA